MSMSAHRLTLNNFIRNGHRIAFLHHNHVPSSNEPQNDEEQPFPGRVSDSFVPLVNLVAHRPDPTQFNANFILPAWPSHISFEGEAQLKHRAPEIFGRGLTFINKPKKSTAEVSVQTDVSGENCNSNVDRLDKMKWELENAIGEELMIEGCAHEAIIRFEGAADHGNVDAMYNLAECFFTANGTAENKREAWSLWKKAASLGHTKSMYSLAVCNLRGEGTPTNEKEAMKWMWMAANSGDREACFYLIVRVMRDGEPERARRLIQTALRDCEYSKEMASWVRDECLPEPCLLVLKQELGLS